MKSKSKIRIGLFSKISIMQGQLLVVLVVTIGMVRGGGMELWSALAIILPVWILFSLWSNGAHRVSMYRIRTSLTGMSRLYNLPKEDKQKCIEAYEFLMNMQAGEKTNTEEETMHVRNYYNVLNEVLSIADLEKLYIPPQFDPNEGLYVNQLQCERDVLDLLNLNRPKEARLLDMGCGRGRISYYFAQLTGGHITGYNIDPNQIQNAKDWAAHVKMEDQLEFHIGDHHHLEDLRLKSESFDGLYSFQAVWPFFKVEELDQIAAEMFRLLKPGARYSCSEYLLTPHFDWNNEEHVALHKLFLPTLAATQSMYPADVCAALERAGFKIILNAPSKNLAFPLCEQKRDLILLARQVIRILEALHILPPWVEKALAYLQRGGEAWTLAEKAKIADLNWRIVAEKPIF